MSKEAHKGKFAAALCAVGLALALVPAAASASTFTPTITADEDSGDAVVGTGCSLREAINAAQTDGNYGGCTAADQDADTINLTSGSTYTLGGTGLNGTDDLNAKGDLDVIGQPGDQTLTIQGNGGKATIDANGAVSGDRVIQFRGDINTRALAAVTLTNLNITGGVESTGEAGGLLIGPWTFNPLISNSRIFGNSSPGGSGGGIRYGTTGSAGTITNSTIESNTAGTGGGIYQEGGPLNVDGSTISGNSATVSAGGGVNLTNPTSLNLTNSTVAGNNSVGDGGGIHVDFFFAASGLALKNATIAGNTADSDHDSSGAGGGVFLTSMSAIASQNSIVGDNSAFSAPDCSASSGFTSNGHNLVENTTGCTFTAGTGDITGDPVLGGLALNGQPSGSPMTKALLFGSPAIGAGDPGTPDGIGTHCEATAENGISRVGTVQPCDIGAYEVPDSDGDSDLDTSDNCINNFNPGQEDNDGDGAGDPCDTDDDNDGVTDAFPDNCQFVSNSSQLNTDGDSQGDACDADDDNDGFPDASDGCPTTAGPSGGCPLPPPPPTTTTPTSTAAGPTGLRAAALAKCKKKHGRARANCKKRANKLPV